MSQWNAYRKTPPESLPVTLTAARQHLRLLTNDDDGIVGDILIAACEHVEEYLQRQLVTATWVLELGGFPAGDIDLPRPPFGEVEAFIYTDDDGDEHDVEGYAAYVSNGIGRLVAPAAGWPSGAKSVRVEYEAGYGGSADVPAGIKHAVLLALSDLYEHTEAQTERPLAENAALARLLAPFRTGDL